MWIPFLHQPTAVFLGAEELATRHNMAVVYGSMRRKERGHYTISIEMLTTRPADLKPGEITRWHCRALEKLLQDQPQYWLWSHNRWKLDADKHPGETPGVYLNSPKKN
jgi:KDO2-lipid IV(A) lauroyltransferase